MKAFRSSISLLLLSFSSFFLDAQTGASEQKELASDELVNPQVPTWVYKTNPLRPLWGPIPFTAEYRLKVETPQARYQSTQIGISYLGKSPVVSYLIRNVNPGGSNTFGSFDIQVRGGRLQFAYKYYLKGLISGISADQTLSSYAPNGYYISPHFSMAYADLRVNHSTMPFAEMTHLNADLVLGRQMFFWDIMALDLFLGAGIKNNIWVFRDPANHNARVVSPSDMGIYSGNYRLVIGFDIGVYF